MISPDLGPNCAATISNDLRLFRTRLNEQDGLSTNRAVTRWPLAVFAADRLQQRSFHHLTMTSSFWQDFRFAWRALVRTPVYTFVAVAVLALGIGANTAVFSVIDAVLLRPLPYPQSERLVLLRERTAQFSNGSVSYPNYLDWRAAQHSFTDLALSFRNSYNVAFLAASSSPPERINASDVTWNFLTVLGVHPELGRDFSEAEDTPGGPTVALISDSLWRRRFSADRTAVGQRILVDGILREIIGIVPQEVAKSRSSDLFIPLGDLRKDPNVTARDNHSFSGFGRLKPGISLALADQDLNTIASELERRYPDSNTGRRVNVQYLLQAAVGNYSRSLYLLLGAVGCVLLIACANVANLQLARASAREKEFAVRAALGANRWRLMRPLIMESVILGFLGGGFALLLALWSMEAIIALSPAHVPRFQEVRLDLSAMGFTAAIALGTGLVAGVWPAWRVSNLATMATALHEGSARGSTGGVSQQRTRAMLVVAQVALAMVLLACANLTIKSFWTLQSEPLGFQPEGLLTLSTSLPLTKYPNEKIFVFYSQLLERIRALPGVTGAATGTNVPFDSTEWDSTFHLTGTPPSVHGQEPMSENNYVSPGYFQTMGIPLLRGRDFGPQDVFGQPRSVIVDESFARTYFPGQDPIGKHIDDNQTRAENPPPMTIIGVVGRTVNDPPGGEPVFANMVQMHYCAKQADQQTDATFMIRVASGDPLRLVEAVRQAVLSLDPELPIADVSTMEANIASGLATRRLTMILLGAFAALALVLASIGLYGVMALSVSQRTRELGIRLALGASQFGVMRLVMLQGAKLVGVGLLIGLTGAFVAGKMLASLLVGVASGDVATLGGVAFLLSAAAMSACWLPARRAMKVDPMTALRNE